MWRFFTCPSADIACLTAAINTANGNRQGNTIVLEAGIYSLTAINNMTDGLNGLPSIAGTLTITGAELEGVVGAEANELPPLPTGRTMVIERNALGSPPPFRLFHVAARGALTLEVLTPRGGDGSSGDGLLNLGTLTIRDSTLVAFRGYRILANAGQDFPPFVAVLPLYRFSGGITSSASNLIRHQCQQVRHQGQQGPMGR